MVDYEKPIKLNIGEELAGIPTRRLHQLLSTDGFNLMIQHLDSTLEFTHINEEHDEVIYLIDGELDIETAEGTMTLKAGELAKLPRNMPHGGLTGRNARMIVLEGKSDG